MRNAPEDDRLSRARHARQVISGSEVRPPATYRLSSAPASGPALVTPTQRNYLVGIAVLLVLGLLLYLFFGFSVASIVFFLLALTLLAGWLVF
ncbi:MAG TPA: hypothetical protein VIL01_08405 [Thermomicrobiales bacterium]